ncbi:hypothetical protein ACFXTH_028497 [Malus domestica]
MESHGHWHPTTHRVRTNPRLLTTRRGPQVGPAARGPRDLCGVGFDARDRVLSHGEDAAHVGLTCFFLLHEVCLTVEIGLKRVMSTGKWRLPRLVSGGFSVGFVMVTSFWLFLPQFFRFGAEIKAFEEYAAVGEFFRNLFSPFVARVG